MACRRRLIMGCRLPELRKLDRYERRAAVRRDRAIVALGIDNLCILPNEANFFHLSQWLAKPAVTQRVFVAGADDPAARDVIQSSVPISDHDDTLLKCRDHVMAALQGALSIIALSPRLSGSIISRGLPNGPDVRGSRCSAPLDGRRDHSPVYPRAGALSSDSTLSRWAPSTRHVAAFPSLAAGFIASSRAVFRRAVDSRDQARPLPGDRPRADCWWR